MNLAELVESHPADRPALVSRGRSTTYGELRSSVAAVRGGLTGLGLEPGDRLALIAANNRVFVEAYLAALGAGLVVVPLNPQSPAPELASQINTVGARAVVVGPTAGATMAAIDQAAMPTVEHLIAARPDTAARSDEVSGAEPYAALVDHDPQPIVARVESDLAVLMFTSGTAGAPRAAMLTHGNLKANLDQVQAVPAMSRGPEDVTFGVLPFFHIFGLNVVLNPTLLVGSTAVLVERFEPSSAVETIGRHAITTVTGPPTMWAAFASTPDLPADAFASVRLAGSGASKLPVEVARAMLDRFGLHVHEGYGLTETSPIVASSVGTNAPFGSIGRPLPGVEVRLVDLAADEIGDGAGTEVVLGDEGEIWVRGSNVFSGYWNDRAATEAVFASQGWLRTGDLAVMDDGGFLHIVDRAKDLIIVSGFNVYPAEVEEVLVQHPAVEEAAVVGIAHPHTGEAVKAFVVTRPDMESEEDELIGFVGRHLARYKCPTKISFVDEIPRGLGGKILRRRLL